MVSMVMEELVKDKETKKPSTERRESVDNLEGKQMKSFDVKISRIWKIFEPFHANNLQTQNTLRIVLILIYLWYI